MDTSVQIIELNTATPEFLTVPTLVYADDPNYVPSTAVAVKASVDRPEFKGKQTIRLAERNGRPAGRLVARISPSLSGDDGEPLGMIGNFDAIDDEPLIHALLDDAMTWFRKRSVKTVIGPMDGDTWHKYRFKVGPDDMPPFMMEPYNATHYSKVWESYGFTLEAGYHSLHIADSRAAAEKLKKFHGLCIRRGYTFRNFDLNDYDGELALFYRLSCEIFAGNHLYTSVSEEVFRGLYAGAKAILDPKLVWFAFDKAGDPAGFVFCFPDYFRAQQAMGGKTHLLAKLRFLLKKGAADTLNIKTLGSTPKHRGSGLGPALMYLAFQSGIDRGFEKANMCLIKDDNDSGRLDGGQGSVMRRYTLYRHRLGND